MQEDGSLPSQNGQQPGQSLLHTLVLGALKKKKSQITGKFIRFQQKLTKTFCFHVYTIYTLTATVTSSHDLPPSLWIHA